MASRLEDIRSKITLKEDNILNTRSIRDPNAFRNIDNSFDLGSFQKNCEIQIKSIDHVKQKMVLDLLNADVAIANALRRILLSEIPTVAFEKVVIHQNTSVLQDENLAHRISLIPLNVNPRDLGDCPDDLDDLDPSNTLVFTLHEKCTAKEDVKTGPPAVRLNNHTITSRQLKWVPQQGQEFWKNLPNPPAPIESDGLGKNVPIPIVKLRENHEIELALFAVKGTGKTHAKWSPVCTAFYKLHPDISFKEEIRDENAEKLKEMCQAGVFDIEDGVAVIGPNARHCTMCRECIREREDWPAEEIKKINLARKRNHYIFEIESVGQYPVEDLFLEAIKILSKKFSTLGTLIDQEEEVDADDGETLI